MKKINYVLIFIFCMLTFGCGKQTNTEEIDKKYAVYTNLAGEESKEEIVSILEHAQISKEQLEIVMKWIDDFNQIATNYTLANQFLKLPTEGVDYQSLILDDTKDAYSYLQWLNCRLTAYFLIKDQIETSRKGSDLDPWLMFDIEAIDTVPEFYMPEEQRADFIMLFNQIPVPEDASLSKHQTIIEDAWKERKIHLDLEKTSLICVYLHSVDDQVRFVGHTGILSEMEDGFLFFEKYSNLDPFQVTLFQNRKDLESYLLSRKDLYGDERELSPIITENGKVMKTDEIQLPD